MPVSFVDEVRDEFERSGGVQRTARHPMLREALASSSPVLLADLLNDDAQQRAEAMLAVAKYAFRIAQRPTPFGGFAAVGLMGVGTAGPLLVDDPRNAVRVARVSSPVLQFMARRALRDAGEILVASPEETLQANASLWLARSGYRFLELRSEDEGAGFFSASIAWTEAIGFVVERLGARTARTCDLVSAVTDAFGCRSEDALDLVIGLVAAGALVMTDRQHSPFGPSSQASKRGDDDLQGWVEELEAAGVDPERNVELYGKVQCAIRTIAPQIAPSDHLNVTHVLPGCAATLDLGVMDRIGRDVGRLLPLLVDRGDARLVSLARSIELRHGSRPVPLLEALDGEQGFGFGHDAPRPESVVPPLPPAKPEGTANLDRRGALMLSIVVEAIRTGSSSVDLSDEHLVGLDPVGNFAELGVLGCLLDSERGRPSFELRSLSPACGTAFHGRFQDCGGVLSDALREASHDEVAVRNGALVVDVVHVPRGRSADVVCGPRPGRPYVDLMGGMDHADPHCIPVSRLFVLARNGELVLLDEQGRRLACRIGHVFDGDSDANVTAFRLLSAIQSCEAGRQRGVWDDLVSTCRWFPRLVYGSVLVARERWRLNGNEAAAMRERLLSGEREVLAPGFHERRLDRVRLVRGDNFLLLDLRYALDRAILVRELGRPGAHVLECHEDEPSYALTPAGARHVFEVALSFAGPIDKEDTPSVERFDMTWDAEPRPPGGEWLYYKVFGDEEALETATAGLFEVLTGCLASRAIASSFFLRYDDETGRHFRLRLRCVHADDARLVDEIVVRHLRADVSRRVISRFEISTYQPETYRYGGPIGMSVSERIFSCDTAAALKSIAISGDVPRWKVALLSVWRLVSAMIDEGERPGLLAWITKRYAAEFKLDGDRLRAIDRRYRELRTTVAAIMSGREPDLAGVEEVLAERDAKVVASLRELEGTPVMGDRYFYSSHLHMCANRLLGPDGRMQEAILMTYMHRNLLSCIARGTVPEGL